MQNKIIFPGQNAKGRVRLGQADAAPRVFSDNLVLYGWGQAVARDLVNAALGRAAVGFNAVYFEFENMAAPGDRVLDAPTLERDRDRAYFDGLSVHAARDYMRVPVTAVNLINSDEAVYAIANGIAINARTRFSVGVHGKPFSEAANSVVFGAFLASAEDWDTPSQDIIVHGHYFEADEQEPKYDIKPVAADWEIYYT